MLFIPHFHFSFFFFWSSFNVRMRTFFWRACEMLENDALSGVRSVTIARMTNEKYFVSLCTVEAFA